MRARARLKVAAIGFVGMAVLAAQDPDVGSGIIATLPAGALQQGLTVRILLTDLDLR